MLTRFKRITDAIMEAGWLAALVVAPLFFNTFSNRVFEPDKLHLIRSIALVMAVAWIAQLLDTGTGVSGRGVWQKLRRTPLALPTLALIGAYLISTALSVTPHISFFGSYVRMQGAFSFLSYATIFAVLLTHLRTRSQLNRLIYTIVLSSLPISIYGIIQHYGLDALPWGGDVKERVAANMGNAIFVAAYLIIALFLTLERLLESIVSLLSEEQGSTGDALRAGAYLFILAVQIIAIVFTQSRGPWLGLAAGLYVFALLGVLLLGRWAAGRARMPKWIGAAVRPVWFSLIGLTVAAAAFVIVLNLPEGPLAPLRQMRYINRLGTLLSTTDGTNAVRVLIWEGVVDMMIKPHPPIEYPDGSPDRLNFLRPLVGYGPESMWVAYNRFYPPDLAHYEARNASPDRSHNETFDTLVRTGFLGFGIQLWLFVSVFYYALRWLGLMQGPKQRNLFLALLGGGALLGVLVPLLADGSLRLAGIGLPAGLIAGVILYVTFDLLLTPASAPAVTDAASGRRQLLILALFAAVVAFFVEVHFGIAIASTQTHFWALAAVLVVVGMGWLEEPGRAPAQAPVPAPADVRPATAVRPPTPRSKEPLPTGGGSRHTAKAAKTPEARRTGGHEPRPAPRPAADATSRAAAAPHSPLLALMPYVAVGALITLVLTWNYTVNQTGQTSAFSVLWNAFTTRVDANQFRIIQSPMLLMLMLFTWLVGGLLAITESAHTAGRPSKWVGGAVLYAGTTGGVWLIYGLIQSSRGLLQGLAGMNVFRRIVDHIVVFDVALLLLLLGTAAAIVLAERRNRTQRAFRDGPWLPLAGGGVALVVALLLIVNVNIRTVQADTYYKQGLSYEGAGAWESAAVLYHQAAQLQPNEDFYYLFLGRALLQLASTAQPGTASLPAELARVPTAELLSLTDRALRARDREDILRGANAALTAAQRLNPLNTDHSANLARLNRSWAFVKALGPNDAPSNALLRQIVATRPQDVDQPRLDAALTHYRQATSLSPKNAQLWNEMASVQFIMGDTEAALQTLDHSRNVDPIYTQTFLLRGDLLATLGDKAGALNDYRAVAKLAPNDVSVQSAVGVYSAQTGDAEGALVAFRKMAEVEQIALNSAQDQLRSLEAQVARAGGYSMLLSTATARRDQLQGAVGTHRSQLHLAYRNMALVLRDANRPKEALEAARTALSFASDAEKSTVEALIADIQKRQSGG